MPQTAMETTQSVGNMGVPKITPLGSLDVDQGTTALTPEGENQKPFLAIICNGI
ncbi:hypothetical protein ACFWPQ_36615 [Streptomyces sp. NPDC058464]|uniref:hypothetical protein n=1 Tax=Streptomyces sp. NPDC058464 TaxID=3346511 RepID=UPI003665A567